MGKIFDPTHPALDGHFPGDPIVPGALLLQEVLESFLISQPSTKVRGFSSVKFLRPLRPNIEYMVQFQGAKGENVFFEVVTANETIASGQLCLSRS